MNNAKSLTIKRENSLYSSCYCEENIWKLCEKIKDFHTGLLENCFVIFVSNDAKQVPIWFQKSGCESRDYMCVWDYHVFLIQKHPVEVLVYDFDTVLEFPTSFDNYVRKAIKPEYNIYHERLFRVIPSEVYLLTFASDRSHMRKPDGSYMSEPPAYMPIKTEDFCGHFHETLQHNRLKLAGGQWNGILRPPHPPANRGQGTENEAPVLPRFIAALARYNNPKKLITIWAKSRFNH